MVITGDHSSFLLGQNFLSVLSLVFFRCVCISNHMIGAVVLQTSSVLKEEAHLKHAYIHVHVSIILEHSVFRYSLMSGEKGTMTTLAMRRTSSLGNLTSSGEQDARRRRRSLQFLHSHSRLDPLQTPQTILTARSSSRRFCRPVRAILISYTSIAISVMSVRSVARGGTR